jgi:hypothetical protein
VAGGWDPQRGPGNDFSASGDLRAVVPERQELIGAGLARALHPCGRQRLATDGNQSQFHAPLILEGFVGRFAHYYEMYGGA